MAFALTALIPQSPIPPPIFKIKATQSNTTVETINSYTKDASFIKRAAILADKSAGLTSPHPNFGCVIVSSYDVLKPVIAGEGFLYAQGTTPAEVLAVEAAGEFCRGSTAYLNMEPGDCHGDDSAVSALVKVCFSV